MKTRSLILACLFLISKHVLSQDLPEIVPPSPEATSLSKFVEVPVSHYTGLPNISVPFYTIDLDGLQIPISLSYHARGIRVEELAPRVGLGWALNYGGMISRQTRGKLDDKLNTDTKGYLTQNYYDTFETNESTRISVYNDDVNNKADLVPDQFLFNFLGYSGKFIFDQKTKLPLLQDYADFKIEPIFTNATNYTLIKAWVITNENGFKFYFGQYNGSAIIANLDDTEASFAYTTNNGLINLGNPPLSTHYNSWQLVAIESPTGNKIEFDYEIESTQFYRRSYDQKEDSGGGFNVASYFSRIRSKEYKIKEITFNKGSITFIKDTVEREDVNFGYSLKEIEVKDLKTNTVVKYRLNYSYAYDNNPSNTNPFLLLYDSKAKKRLFLNNVEKISRLGTIQPYYSFDYIDIQDLPNRFSNSQDVWGYYNGKSNGEFLTFFDYGNEITDRTVDTLLAQKGLLNKITLPTGGTTEFEFEANKAYVPTYFKDLFFKTINPTYAKSKAMLKGPDFYIGNKTYEAPFTIENDVFGNIKTTVQFMGDYGTCSTTQPLTTCKYRVTIQGVSSSSYHQIFMGTNNNFVALPPGDYKIVVEQLTGIDDPNDFINAFSVILSWKESLDDTKAIYSGGNRIKKTILNSADNGVIEKSYEYLTDLNESSGLVFSLPSYYFIKAIVSGVPGLVSKGARPGSPLTYEQGNHAGYSHVTEYINGNTVGDGGKNEYSFTLIPDMGDFYVFPYNISMDNEWMRGKLLTSKAYKKTVSGYEVVNEVENIYKYANTATPYSITNPPLPPQSYMLYSKDNLQFHIPLIRFKLNETNPVASDHNGYKVYNLSGGTQHLYSSKTTSYYNSLPVVTETEYYYDYINHYQPNQSVATTSDGESIITKTFYPDDVTTTSALGADVLTSSEKAAIDKLKSGVQHRIAEAVQTESYKDENKNGVADAGELLSRQRTNYRDWDSSLGLPTNTDIILPEYVQTALESNTLENRIQFQSYYSNGNVKEVKKTDGTTIVYIWGYEQQYPIAKIEHATYSQVSGQVSNLQSKSNLDDDTCLDSGSCDEKNLRTALTTLRNSVPNAMVTTYTYDPLVGVTSVTDPKGYTMYYLYDEFNRLKQVKDDAGYVLSENTYYYKNQ